MVRSTVPASIAAFAALAGLFSAVPVRAQVAAPAASTAPEPFKFSDGKVSIHTTGISGAILHTILKEMKVPYVIGAISSPERVSFMTLNVDDLPLERALSLVCAASTPRLQWEKQDGVFVVTMALPALFPAPPTPPAPQVHVTNNLPRQAGLAASLAVTGPDAIDTLLELRLLSLQAERKTLRIDFSADGPMVKRNEAEIKAVEQAIALRRAQKSAKMPERKAAQAARVKPARKLPGG